MVRMIPRETKFFDMFAEMASNLTEGATTLRDLGLAARLTSGYLREADAESRRAEGSLHAWAEVYLPGAGWVGMDPTNGIFCNHNFIAAAVGIEPADVTPIDGSYYEPRPTESKMTSRLELVNL